MCQLTSPQVAQRLYGCAVPCASAGLIYITTGDPLQDNYWMQQEGTNVEDDLDARLSGIVVPSAGLTAAALEGLGN